MVLTNATVTTDDWGKPGDLFVPKLHYSRQLGRALTYREVICSELVEFFRTENFERAGVELRQTSADQILAAVQEMNQRLLGTWPRENATFSSAVDMRFKEIQRQAHIRLAGLGRDPGCFLMYLSKARFSTEFARQNPWYLELESGMDPATRGGNPGNLRGREIMQAV